MDKKRNIYLLLLVGLFTITSSCEKDNEITPDIILISGETLDIGEVPAGSAGLGTFTVEGMGLGHVIYLSISGDSFSLDKEMFPAANIKNSANVFFAPVRTATQGPVTAIVEITSEGITKSLTVTATIVPPASLPVDTEVYFNNMEFGKAHNDVVVAADIEGSQTLHPTVTATYFVTDSGLIKTSATSSKCSDNSAGDCGNALVIIGGGRQISISLAGLEAGRNYELSYWIRPGGSSDRFMSVTITGDGTVDENYAGSSSTYTERTRTGIADVDGNLVIVFEYTSDSTSRSITIDDVKVVAK